MPSVISDVHIKRTAWGLSIRLGLLTVSCFVIAGFASYAGGTFWVFLVIFWFPAIAFALAQHQAALTTTGDVLAYSVPLLRTRAWHRQEIGGFGLESSQFSRGWTAHIRMETLTGEQVAFRAIDASMMAEHDVLDGWLATLQDWLEAADKPSVD